MSGFLARHGAHLVVLGGPIVLLAGMFAVLELTRPDRTRRAPDASTRLLGLIWAAVATTHLAVIAEHFGESPLLGTFFVVVSLAQYTYAVAVILRPSRRLLLAGLVVNLSVVVLWCYTRIVAVPFGLGPREPVGIVDLTATALEVTTVVLTWSILQSTGAPGGRGLSARRQLRI